MMRPVISMITCTLGLLVLGTTMSFGAETIYGTARGEQCFRDTKFGNSPISALEICNEALKKDVMSRKDRARTLVNRGINYNALNRYDAALADFEKALGIWENLPEAYANRGNTRMLMKEYEAARADYNLGIGQ